jgi:hypothetical protein
MKLNRSVSPYLFLQNIGSNPGNDKKFWEEVKVTLLPTISRSVSPGFKAYLGLTFLSYNTDRIENDTPTILLLLRVYSLSW